MNHPHLQTLAWLLGWSMWMLLGLALAFIFQLGANP